MRAVEVCEEAGATSALRERAGDLDLVMRRVPLLTSRALGTDEAFGQLAMEARPDRNEASSWVGSASARRCEGCSRS